MPRLSRIESRAQTRERIRVAARQEFSKRGYGATTIDLITETADFSRGAFYANYQSKQDLLLELMAESQEQEIAIWHDLVAHIDDFEALLLELERRFDSYAGRRDWWLLHAELQLEAERQEKVGALQRAYSERTIKGLEALLASLFAKAGIVGRIDPALAATALRALAHGLMFEAAPAPEQKKLGQAITLFLRAILALPKNNNEEVA